MSYFCPRFLGYILSVYKLSPPYIRTSRSALRIESEKGDIKVISPGFVIEHLLLVSHHSPEKSTGRVVPAKGVKLKYGG